jgi:hypothetical protein
MTTPRERRCLDLIFAALEGLTVGLDGVKAHAKKLSVVLGLAVYLAEEIGLDLDDVIEVLQCRFAEYPAEVTMKADG